MLKLLKYIYVCILWSYLTVYSVTKTEDVKKEETIEASPSNKRPHEEVKYADTSKKPRQEEEDDADIISDIK